VRLPLGLHVCALRVLGRWRAGILLLGRRRASVLLLGVLLILRGVGVLVVDGGLLLGLPSDVGGDRVLLHWDWEVVLVSMFWMAEMRLCVFCA
jgi:hypothetical protein